MQKTAIITGAAQGIGRVLVEKLSAQGYCISAWDNDPEAISEVSAIYKKYENLIWHKVDVSSPEAVALAVEATLKKWPDLHLLINNAAIAVNKPLDILSVEEWQKVIDVNLSGTLYCSKFAAQALRKSKGSIINMCSTRALMSEPDTEAYSASKGGVYALTHALALSLGPDIRVNSISPGWIEVSHLKKSSMATQYVFREEDHSQHPCGRVGIADDIASMVIFLADEKNGFITGQNFVVDGGMTKKMIYR
ncbi:MAG: SDR family oxidoreductase [Cyclobacteriaceae bacterium]|nr:SDR family oxidoreductase [Cyclobacteriaceae bacterium]